MTRRKQITPPTRATVLVDIDGVLNAFAARGPLPVTHRIVQAGKYAVVLDNRHPGWMRELAEVADLRWASMWQRQAGPVFGAIADIGVDWPFLDFDKHNAALPWHAFKQARTGAGVGSYKFPLIEALAEDGQPLVWIDDDMTLDQMAWARKRSACGLPTLFIRPEPQQGLTLEQFENVLGFAQRFVLEEVA